MEAQKTPPGKGSKRKPCASTEKVSIRSSRRGRAGQCTVHVCMRRTAANGDTGGCFWLRSSPPPPPALSPNPFPVRARLFVNLPEKTPTTNSFLENTECMGKNSGLNCCCNISISHFYHRTFVKTLDFGDRYSLTKYMIMNTWEWFLSLFPNKYLP